MVAEVNPPVIRVRCKVDVEYEAGVWFVKVCGSEVARVSLDYELYELVNPDNPWAVDELVHVEEVVEEVELEGGGA